MTDNCSPTGSAPVANNDSAQTTEGVPVTVNVLGNDTDADGDNLTVASVTQPAHGGAQIDGNEVAYTPASGFAGTDTFTYQASDGTSLSNSATVTVTVTGPQQACAPPFPDVPASNSFCADIAWLVDNHITTGYADGHFHPLGAVTRQAMAAFLYRLDNPGKTAPPCATKPFRDVPTTNEFCGDIAWLVQHKIASGFADGGFHPTAEISRQAMAAFMYRVANPGTTAPACTTAPFDDVPASSEFCADITWLVRHRITTGYPDGGFHPTAAITRQAMAAFLHRLAPLL